jgi:glycosyltransferase involved in cell wall biosynthesis
MKIAVLGIKGIPGKHGVEIVVDSLVPYLSAMGHDITVYGYDSYTNQTKDYCGVRIKTVNGSSRKNIEMISHMWNASIDTRKDNYDIIHIHSTDPCLLAWLPRSRLGVVATSHGRAYIREKWSTIAKSVSKFAEYFFMYIPKRITSVSKDLAEYYQSEYKRCVAYIPNGIKIRKKPDIDLLGKWNIKVANYLFCSAGRMERTKGIHTLIEAYKKLKPDISLVIAGGGSGTDFQYFDELKHNKPDNVIFTGFLTGDDLYALYAHAKIFIFPSEYEAMSMALLEGLSFGTPTIYSDIPENRAVADELGYSFKVSSTDSLVDQINYVLSNYEEAVKTGVKAKNVITQRHDWKVIANQYNEIYEQMKKHERN